MATDRDGLAGEIFRDALSRAADGFLESATRGAADPPPSGAPESRLVGQRFGRYRILRLVGVGGMGAVYEATQDNPHRIVALKVMKPGIASRSALKRFASEAQILGRLRHPGIAQVFDAGLHDEDGVGVPFFVMEYIPDARPITEYAQARGLDVRAKLALFEPLCDALQHGHEQGIIHRDLKPENVLVDSAGRIKVIDFGVARITDSDLALTTLQTDVGQLVGTLQYMSPEQVRRGRRDRHGREPRRRVEGRRGIASLRKRVIESRRVEPAMAP